MTQGRDLLDRSVVLGERISGASSPGISFRIPTGEHTLRDAPDPRTVHPPGRVRAVESSDMGGLHRHHKTLVAYRDRLAEYMRSVFGIDRRQAVE